MLLKNLAKRKYYRGNSWNFLRRFQDIDDIFDKQMRMMERDFERFRRGVFSDFASPRQLSNNGNDRQSLQSQDTTDDELGQQQQQQTQRYQTSDSRSDMYVDGVRIRQHVYDSVKEKNGQMIPFQKKEVYCEPACDLKTLEQYAKMEENVGGEKEQKLFTQFLEDAKAKGHEPKKIQSFQNIVEYDPSEKKKKYTIKINYVD